MTKRYSQLRASFAIAKASLLAMLRSPTSVVFSLLFPIIFIVVFGSIVNNTDIHIKLGIAGTCDTSNVIYKNVSKLKIIDLVTDTAGLDEELRKGRITAILDIRRRPMPFGVPGYRVNLLSSNSAVEKLPLLQSVLGDIIYQLNSVVYTQAGSVAELNIQRISGRQYRQIDFILPGQLGFSLLMAGVFGSAFLLRSSFTISRCPKKEANPKAVNPSGEKEFAWSGFWSINLLTVAMSAVLAASKIVSSLLYFLRTSMADLLRQ